MTTLAPPAAIARRACLLGATGTISQATLRALVLRGHDVVCLTRPHSDPAQHPDGVGGIDDGTPALAGAEARSVDMANALAIARDGFRGERFDAVVSCMASRTGTLRDAWAVDSRTKMRVLRQRP